MCRKVFVMYRSLFDILNVSFPMPFYYIQNSSQIIHQLTYCHFILLFLWFITFFKVVSNDESCRIQVNRIIWQDMFLKKRTKSG